MEKISQSVVKKDHAPKVSGRSVYVADYPSEGVLCGKLLHAKVARAKVLGVEVLHCGKTRAGGTPLERSLGFREFYEEAIAQIRVLMRAQREKKENRA